MYEGIRAQENNIIKQSGKAALCLGACFFLFFPAELRADEALEARIAQEKQNYISKYAGICSMNLSQQDASGSIGAQGSSEQTAYQKCLQKYGVVYSLTNEELGLPAADKLPFEDLQYDNGRFIAIVETENGEETLVLDEEELQKIVAADQLSGLNDFYSLDEYGKERLMEHLEKTLPGYSAKPAQKETQERNVKGRQSSGSNAPRIYRRPSTEDGEQAPSRVFRNFDR